PSIDDILKRRGEAPEADAKAGSGSVFGGKYSPTRKSGSQGGLEDILGQILGGSGGGAAPKTRGGLGGALDELSDLSTPGKGGASPIPTTTTRGGGSFGDVLNDSFDKFGEPEQEPTAEHEDLARVLLRAMLQAAKSDGKIDADEKKKLIDNMGDATREDMDFIQAELAKPVDIQGLVGDTPRGSESQVYMMSVMGIDLDSKREAEYLHALAQALGIDHASVNAIHKKLGVASLYR
ncbi:MAG: DUF533 domain-containing protein, partial [Deltaproteobacteria bacterium]